ncbi:MAG: hypothetical protein WCI95_03105 [bacterium]
MAMVCDACHVMLIRANVAKPLAQVNGANGSRWEKQSCFICGTEDDCAAHNGIRDDVLQAARVAWRTSKRVVMP